MNVNKGIRQDKLYFLGINVSTKYSKDVNMEKWLKKVGLFKEQDSYLFLHGFKSFLFHSTERQTGFFRFHFLLSLENVRTEKMYELLKAIQERDYIYYEKVSEEILNSETGPAK